MQSRSPCYALVNDTLVYFNIHVTLFPNWPRIWRVCRQTLGRWGSSVHDEAERECNACTWCECQNTLYRGGAEVGSLFFLSWSSEAKRSTTIWAEDDSCEVKGRKCMTAFLTSPLSLHWLSLLSSTVNHYFISIVLSCVDAFLCTCACVCVSVSPKCKHSSEASLSSIAQLRFIRSVALKSNFCQPSCCSSVSLPLPTSSLWVHR